MNEAQSLRTVRNLLRLENLSADIAAPVQRELTRILQEVAAMVEAMDADPLGSTLARQARWRTYEAQLRAMLQPANDEFYDLLVRELAAEIPRQVQDAERLLLDAGITPYQTATEVLPAGVGTDGSVGIPQITRTQLYRVAQETEVLNRPLQRLFQSEVANPPGPPLIRGGPFIESQIKQIDAVVKRGFLLGETNSEIAKNLLTEGAARSRREAATISRTAVMQMSSDAHQSFYDANSSVIAGFEMDALLDWRTCPVCSPWDGRTAEKREDLPAVPRHPNCVLGDTQVSAGQIIAATRAVYSGNIVTVRTNGGRHVSVTAKHPMLTRNGWVAAEDLAEGMELLCYVAGHPLGTDEPDFNDVPTCAEDIFQSLLASSPMAPASVPASPMHFHGDGGFVDGNVDVVWADRPLVVKRDLELVAQSAVVGRDAKLPSEPRLRSADLLLLWMTASANGLVCVAGQCQAFFRGELTVAEEHALAAVARSDSRLFEPSYNNRARAAKLLGHCLDALPGVVAAEEIVNVQVELRDHVPVYDFTTASSSYGANGIVTHNCRCSILPLTETELELRKERGPQRRTVIELVPYDGPDSKPKETSTQRVYAKTATVDGVRYWRVARDIKQADHPLTHGEFLAQTTDVNLEKALFTKKRAKAFREQIAAGASADAALVRVTQAFHQPSQMAPSLRKKQRGIPALGRSAAPRARPKVRALGGR